MRGGSSLPPPPHKAPKFGGGRVNPAPIAYTQYLRCMSPESPPPMPLYKL